MNNTSSSQEIMQTISQARVSFLKWRKLDIQGRISLLTNLFDTFEKHSEEISQLITKEIGKPISQTRGEVSFFQSFNKWTLENAPEILTDKILFEDEVSVHKQIYEPIGVIAAIIPWNSPFGLLSWKLFSNLVVGNVVVFKHSEYCSLVAMYLEKLIQESGLPDNIIQFIYGGVEQGQELLEQEIDMVSFTGSTKVGREIFKKAGEKFLKSTMELGGSNPGIILEDADLDLASDVVLSSRFGNCGQNCDAIKRIIIHESIYKKFIDLLSEKLEKLVVGNPMEESTYFGKLVSDVQVKLAQGQLDDALSKGAQDINSLEIPNELEGNYFSPVLLENISTDMKVWTEEVFAPILPIITFKTIDEAIKLANDSEYGLGATIFTMSKEQFNNISSQLEVGNIEMNNLSQWLACIPFGGYKYSGIGRENGAEGLKELVQVKVISEERI